MENLPLPPETLSRRVDGLNEILGWLTSRESGGPRFMNGALATFSVHRVARDEILGLRFAVGYTAGAVETTAAGGRMLEQLLGSRLRARVIGWLFTHPDERFYVRQLTELLSEDSTNLSRELARLESLGILVSEREGQQKYYRPNPRSSIFEELKTMAVKTAGAVDVLRRALEPQEEHIQVAFVFGSFARQEQTSESDIDLMIVGDVDEIALQDCIARAESDLHRTINYSLLSQEEYNEKRRSHSGFVAAVANGPRVIVLGALDVN
jgi:predicted nucleotidyltransferase